MMTTDRWTEALDRSRESVLAAGRTGRYAAAALAQPRPRAWWQRGPSRPPPSTPSRTSKPGMPTRADISSGSSSTARPSRCDHP